jgi:hypothetical protein
MNDGNMMVAFGKLFEEIQALRGIIVAVLEGFI